MIQRVNSYILHLLLLAISIVWVYPLVWTITSSLKTNQEFYDGALSPLPSGFSWSLLLPSSWHLLSQALHLENYSRAWYIGRFHTYFTNTFLFSAIVVCIVVLLCGLTGYALARSRFPGRTLFIGAITVTSFIPAGYTIIPVWQLINALGLKNSFAGLILAEAGGTHVLYILLFMAYFMGIPKELEESAEVDGAGYVRTFLTIMLPLSKPIIATTAILQFISSWNSFFIPLVFTLTRPELRTLGVGMLSFIQEDTHDMVGMAAAATISLIPIIVIFVIFQRYFVEGMAGSVKG
jgi:multiple sugar transport system permease protein